MYKVRLKSFDYNKTSLWKKTRDQQKIYVIHVLLCISHCIKIKVFRIYIPFSITWPFINAITMNISYIVIVLLMTELLSLSLSFSLLLPLALH